MKSITFKAKSIKKLIKQIDKQQWEINTDKELERELTEFTLRYSVYAYDLSVRSAFINDEYAFFNGTSVFLCVRGFEEIPHKLFIGDDQDTLSANIVTAMSRSETNNHAFYASDYFELIDH